MGDRLDPDEEPIRTDPGIRIAELRGKVARIEAETQKAHDRRTLVNVGLVLTTIALFVTIFTLLRKEAIEEGGKGSKRAEAVEQKVDKHIEKEEQTNQEIRRDILEVYKVMPKRSRSSRMEKAGDDD